MTICGTSPNGLKNWSVDAEWDVKSGNITVIKEDKKVKLKMGV